MQSLKQCFRIIFKDEIILLLYCLKKGGNKKALEYNHIFRRVLIEKNERIYIKTSLYFFKFLTVKYITFIHRRHVIGSIGFL